MDYSFDPLSTFSQIDWDWFGCFNIPNSNLDDLLNSIPILKDGDITYFSIHIQEKIKDNLHIHFCTKTDYSSKTLVSKYKGLVNTKIEKFDLSKIKECYTYFTDKSSLRKGNQKILFKINPVNHKLFNNDLFF